MNEFQPNWEHIFWFLAFGIGLIALAFMTGWVNDDPRKAKVLLAFVITFVGAAVIGMFIASLIVRAW